MKKLIFILMVGSLFIGCATTNNPEPNNKSTQNSECVEFISLSSAKNVARELGWTEMKVVRDYKVNLWEKPSSQGKGGVVGSMRAGSNARLIKRSGSDYYVQSPLDKSKGWVSDVQVDKIVTLNPKTFERCKK